MADEGEKPKMSAKARQRFLLQHKLCEERAARRRSEGSQNTVGTFPRTRVGRPKNYALAKKGLRQFRVVD